MTSRFLPALVLLAGCDKQPAPSVSAPAPAPVPSASPATAPALAIVDGELGRQTLTLAGKPIYPPSACTPDQPACAKLQEVAGGFERLTKLDEYALASSTEKVMLFQSGTLGNACNGGPLFFVRTRPDGTYRLSEPVDFCGGPAPMITRTNDVVRIVVPAHMPNHGTEMIPSSASEYDLVADKVKTLK